MSHQTLNRKTIDHYRQLAAGYDERWRRYTEHTLTEALDGLHLAGTEQMLDLGCGTGELERLALARFGPLRIVGIDVCQPMLAIAREKFASAPEISFQLAEAEALPFAPETFDVVICVNMLHHVQHHHQLFRECARVLRPKGQLILVAWCRDFWRNQLMHRWLQLTDRTYTGMPRMKRVTDLLEAQGLVVTDTRRFTAPPWYGMMRVLAEKRGLNHQRHGG